MSFEEINVSNEAGQGNAEIMRAGDHIDLTDYEGGGKCGSMWSVVHKLRSPKSPRMRYIAIFWLVNYVDS